MYIGYPEIYPMPFICILELLAFISNTTTKNEGWGIKEDQIPS